MSKLGKARLTSYASQELASKILNLTAWEGNEAVGLEEVENTLAQQIRYNANVLAEVETVPQMDALVPIIGVVLL